MALTVNEEIELINDIISAAINHGGDMGGAYFSDWFGLETAIGTWIKARGLEGQYAPNSDSYLSKIQRITMSDIDRNESRYYIAFNDDMPIAQSPSFNKRGVPLTIICFVRFLSILKVLYAPIINLFLSLCL